MGVRVFIDDFGAGYSSFGYLSKLPVAGVKVDRSITIGVDSNPKQRAVMQAVLDLAVACGLECIVEGVETEAEAAVLRTLGATAFRDSCLAVRDRTRRFNPKSLASQASIYVIFR